MQHGGHPAEWFQAFRRGNGRTPLGISGRFFTVNRQPVAAQNRGEIPAVTNFDTSGGQEIGPFIDRNPAGATRPGTLMRRLGTPPGGKTGYNGTRCRPKIVALVSGISYSVAERAQLKKK